MHQRQFEQKNKDNESEMEKERQRILSHYNNRDTTGGATSFWTMLNPVVLHIAQQRERVLLALARRYQISLAGARVLDVGCGAGGEMINLCRWGGAVADMVGFDLSDARLRMAVEKYGLHCVRASADHVPFSDGSFDVVMQNVVFSSIVDSAVRHAVAAEMQRVLAPGGVLIWYDARWSRSRDPAFLPLPRRSVEQLFDGIDFHWQTLTTDLGVLKLANMLGGNAAMTLTDQLPWIRTHLLGIGFKSHD